MSRSRRRRWIRAITCTLPTPGPRRAVAVLPDAQRITTLKTTCGSRCGWQPYYWEKNYTEDPDNVSSGKMVVSNAVGREVVSGRRRRRRAGGRAGGVILSWGGRGAMVPLAHQHTRLCLAAGKVGQNAHWVYSSIYSGMEYLGEGVINFFGFDQPQYAWITAQMERDKARRRQRKLEIRQRKAMKLQAQLDKENAAIARLEGAAAAAESKGDVRGSSDLR